MKQHITDEVESAHRAVEVLRERLRGVIFALKSLPNGGGRKVYLKAQLQHLDQDVNLVSLRVNNAKEKLIKHGIV